MSKKYFLCSDIHSFYTPLMSGLIKKGFDRTNPEHVLVVLGDIFDRGFETLEVYNFLRSLPKDRLILIRGNHESLYLDLLKKKFPESHDFSNGTVRTFCQIAGFDEDVLRQRYWFQKAILEEKEKLEQIGDDNPDFHARLHEDVWENKYWDMPQEMWQQIKETVAMSDVTKWLQSDEWVDYFETPHYICVHSWIPVAYQYPFNYTQFPPEEVGYREDWRNATKYEWEDATWGCPWRKAKSGWNKTGKTIICGHWHTSDFFNNLTKQEKKQKDNNPVFKSKRYKLIGLDACTFLSNKVNVLVLDEDEI